MKVICDECNKEFVIELRDIVEVELNIDRKNVLVQYFECSHCKYKYITLCIDDYIEKEQRRYKKLKDHDKRIKCLNNMKTHSDRLKLKSIELLGDG